jgi:hypothetical protein
MNSVAVHSGRVGVAHPAGMSPSHTADGRGESGAQPVVGGSHLPQGCRRCGSIARDKAVLQAAEQPRLIAGHLGGWGFTDLAQPDRRVREAMGPDPDSEGDQMIAGTVVQAGLHDVGEMLYRRRTAQRAFHRPASGLLAGQPSQRHR